MDIDECVASDQSIRFFSVTTKWCSLLIQIVMIWLPTGAQVLACRWLLAEFNKYFEMFFGWRHPTLKAW